MAVFTGSPVSTPQHTVQSTGLKAKPGKWEIADFRWVHTATEGAGTGEMNLLVLPPGRVRVFANKSRLRVASGLDAAALVSIGHRAYVDPDDGSVAEDATALCPATQGLPTLSTNLAGANNDLTFTALAIGGSPTIRYVDPGAPDQALDVTVATTDDITVSLATNAGSAITSTAAEIKAAIEADAEASLLVSVANKTGNDGTGVVVAMGATALVPADLDATLEDQGGEDVVFDSLTGVVIFAQITAGDFKVDGVLDGWLAWKREG